MAFRRGFGGARRGTEVLYRKLSEPKFRTCCRADADYMPVDCKDDQLYYVTNCNASNMR